MEALFTMDNVSSLDAPSMMSISKSLLVCRCTLSIVGMMTLAAFHVTVMMEKSGSMPVIMVIITQNYRIPHNFTIKRPFFALNNKITDIRMKRKYAFACIITALLALIGSTACDTIDSKALPSYAVRIDLGSYALWNTYGVYGMGDYRIFNREKGIPNNFPYSVTTYTGYGGVLLMMGAEMPMAYDLACPVEMSPSITLSIDPGNFEAVCPKCRSHYNPLTGDGGPVSGVAINNKVGMTRYRVMPSNGGYIIAN